MTKKSQKAISNNNCTVYCVNAAKFYIKGSKLTNQINLKKMGAGLFWVNSNNEQGELMTEEQIIALTK